MILREIQEKLDDLDFENKHVVSELEKIEAVSKAQKEIILNKEAKNLATILDEKQETKKDKKDKLDQFFEELEVGKKKGDKKEAKRVQKEKQIIQQNFSVYGKFPLYYLKQMGVLVDITLKNEKIDKLFK